MRAALVLVLSLLPGAALAQASLAGGPLSVAPPAGTAPVRWPDVAYDPTSDAWLAVSGAGDVAGLWLSSDGTALGPAFVVQASPGIYAQAPRVAYAGAGLVIAWHETLASGGTAIRARVVSRAGPITADFPVSPPGTNWEMGAALSCSSASGECLVAWQSTADTRIEAQRIALDGALRGAPIVVDPRPYYFRDPAVALDVATDTFVVAYAGCVADRDCFVAAQRVGAGTGALVGAPLELDASIEAGYVPELAYGAGTREVLAVWHRRSAGAATFEGRRIAGDGTLGPATHVASVGSYDASGLAYNPVSNTFLFVTHGTTAEDVAIELSALGAPIGAPVAFGPAGATGNFNPRVAASTLRAEFLAVTSTEFARLTTQRFSTATRDPTGIAAIDAGAVLDAGGTPGPDAATPDAGGRTRADGTGCGCRAARHRHAPLAGTLALLLLARARRARARPQPVAGAPPTNAGTRRATPARSCALVCLAWLGACAGTPAPTAPELAPESVGAEPPAEASAPTAPPCVALEPAGPPPSILVASWPEVHRPPTRDAHGRLTIYLDAMDGYGPLRVARIDPAGMATDLGEGSDPRFHDGAILYVEGILSDDGHTTLVRVLSDGTTERRPGGTGLLPGLGGPLPPWRAPFTRDGRFMAFARGCEEGEPECAILVYDHVPTFRGDDAPVDRIELAAPRRPDRIFLTEDAGVVAFCTLEEGADTSTLVRVDRTTRERTTAPIAGRCAALSPAGDRVLSSEHDAARGLELVTPATGARTRIEAGLRVAAAAFDACGASVVVVGAVPETDTQRVLRLFFDGRPPLLLLETAGGAELAHVEVDDRGWALVASDEPGAPAHVFVVSLAGGVAAEWTVPGRVFGAALGP